MSLVTVFAAESPDECKNKVYYLDLGNGEVSCVGNLPADLANVDEGKSATFVALKDVSLGSAESINKDLVYDLNGHTLTFGSGSQYKVEGANVTFKNGTIVAAGNAIQVNSANKASTLTFASDVKVEATNGSAIVNVTDAKNATVVNINGTWTVTNEIVECAQKPEENLTINLNATVNAKNSSKSIATLNAGKSVVNVNGGSYTAKSYVFELVNGTLNINGGTLTSTTDHAIVVRNVSGDYKNALKVTGGTIVAEGMGRYALYFDNATTTTKTGTYSITGGEFTSGLDKDDKQLPALYINNPKFLDNYKGMITKGTFTGSIVGNVTIGTNKYKTAAEAAKILVGNATE